MCIFGGRRGMKHSEGQIMAILVTGGAGFIGSHTCVELLNAGEDIVVMDNFYNSNPKALEGIKKITGKDFKFYEPLQLHGCSCREKPGNVKVLNTTKTRNDA